ncbi:gamma-glutamyltransferase 1 [Humitalea rosea]|uniref:Gamma-glutamyltransferase 1 n=1 Tax=Humitalea rosea TaxID=990373 RepID=A0A2W7IME0_9PROT|nr:gamma-glutamyltransferase [Humitalea rosea]PZW48005.1 gamma-glutamyltransferase 1 [Humitalea rosea]
MTEAYVPPPWTTQNWQIAKPGAESRGGIVVCQNHDAARAGIAVLDAGGNAADAAVAAALVLATVEPWNSGLGGIGFAVIRHADGRAETLDFGPVAPAGLDPALFPLTGRMKQDLFSWPEVEGDKNIHGPLSFVIPSSVAGYGLLHETYGRLGRRAVFGPAVALARRGLAQDWFTTLKIANSAASLRLYDESARIYLPGGLPPVAPYQGTPGFFRLGKLAETLERLRDAGWRDFYEGAIAADLVRDITAMGGVVSAADLAGCKALLRPATPVDWRGKGTLWLPGGLTAAPTLEAVMEGMADVPATAPDAAWYVAASLAMRAAYADRLKGLGAANAPEPTETCTTHLTVMDKDGMSVAMTTTLLSSMGSRVVLPATGVLMNNGVMWFDPAPGTPNHFRPGARPLCNMLPAIFASEDGKTVVAAGASGGRRILAAVYQTLAFLLDFGMTPEQAGAQPRIDVSGPEGVTADRRLGAEILGALALAGPCEPVEHAVLPVNFACPNAIVWDGKLRRGISDAMSPWSGAVGQG